MLSREAVQEYREIYKRQYGKEISYEEAQSQGVKLLKLFSLIYKPIKKEWLIGKSEKAKGGDENVE